MNIYLDEKAIDVITDRLARNMDFAAYLKYREIDHALRAGVYYGTPVEKAYYELLDAFASRMAETDDSIIEIAEEFNSEPFYLARDYIELYYGDELRAKFLVKRKEMLEGGDDL